MPPHAGLTLIESQEPWVYSVGFTAAERACFATALLTSICANSFAESYLHDKASDGRHKSSLDVCFHGAAMTAFIARLAPRTLRRRYVLEAQRTRVTNGFCVHIRGELVLST